MSKNDFKNKLKSIESKIPNNEIYFLNNMKSLYCFELNEYIELLVQVDNKFNQISSFEDRMKFLVYFKSLYISQNKKLNEILANCINRTIKFESNDYEGLIAELKQVTYYSFVYDESKSDYENLIQYIEKIIKYKIHLNKQRLYIINKYPTTYCIESGNYIGGSFYYQYKGEVIIYENTKIEHDGFHYRLYYKENECLENRRVLSNILAYISGRPNFEFTKNPSINSKLDGLYEQFSLLDCLKLRKANYINSNVDYSLGMRNPIIKRDYNYDIVSFKKLEHVGILDLYHASLKQFEPLPRCVFLFRVIEYAFSYHYKPTFNPENFEVEDALNYYLEEAMKYNPNPLYFVDYSKGKKNLNSFFPTLKKESKKIFDEWSKLSFLRNKSRALIIYETGRNFTAHGGTKERNMQYDYSKNYNHINNVNIVLELIARYLIELLNPTLQNVVERRKEFYDNIF